MSNKNALMPTEQKEVSFYEDMITVVQLQDSIYVPIRPICELLGVDWASQFRRINRDEILSEVAIRVVVTTTQTKRGRGKLDSREMVALPLDYLNGWLFGINASRVKAEIKPRLLRYQRDCYKVLADAFGRNQITHKPDDIDIEALLADGDPLAMAYQHGMAIVNLAREQLLLRQQFDSRMRSAENKLDSTIARVDAIEAELGNPERFITVSQAEQLSQAVRAVGLTFSKATGGNEYGSVYGELYRRYSINSYKRLPVAKFEDAMNWLKQWYEDLTDGEATPF